MKLFYAALLVLIFSGVLSGCAYIEGRKDQSAAAANASVTTKKSSDQPPAGQSIPFQGTSQPASDASVNPSATASKMLAPIVQ